VLASLASKLGDLDIRKDDSSQSRPGISPSTYPDTASTPAPFEGETAINSQSERARELLAQIVDNTPSIGQNEEVKSALQALSDLVTRQGQAANAATNHGNPALINRSLADIDPGKIETPPWNVASLMLKSAAGELHALEFHLIFY
jgi:hypothetical protein